MRMEAPKVLVLYVPSFDEWLASAIAADLNEDGEIDEADYELFVEILL